MATAWENVAARHGGARSLALLIVLTVAAAPLLPLYNAIGYDAAFLAWAADRLLHGATYGRDVLDVNPPLAVLAYMPAAVLAPLTGLDGGIRVSMLLLTVLSLTCLWHCAERALRLPVAAMLLLFVTLAFPDHFAQREQIVLLLCAPYVAGAAADRRWALLSGAMAGVGFLMKPHFLLALAAVFALRRRVGTEERAIGAAGLAYALVLALFFQPYMREMVPAAVSTYWAISYPGELARQAVFIALAVIPMALAGAPQPGAARYLAATLGFAAAALLQAKGFVYHFIPAYGFMALYLTVRTFNARRPVAVVAALLLLLEATMAVKYTLGRKAVELDAVERAALDAAIDRSRSYTSFVPEPYAAFPAAIHSPSRFVGIAICPIFLPAVARYATGGAAGDPRRATELAIRQALRELANRPDLVITLNAPYDVGGRSFDAMAWFNADPRFRAAWKDYAPDQQIGPLLLYRRR